MLLKQRQLFSFFKMSVSQLFLPSQVYRIQNTDNQEIIQYKNMDREKEQGKRESVCE